MTQKFHALAYTLTMVMIGLASGCVIAPREGYYDHDHHRYYHEHAWHECGGPDEHYCR